ncbi:MAG TPA: MDR family MFS transporter [Spirochaetia bacterium]|nr:MDR family MFS transporter [Spirochaetia bacterium]
MANLDRTKILTLVGVLLALFLGALDQTIVATSLPRIVQDLKGVSRYAWVATSYLLTSTVFVPIYGKLADIYSRKAIELWSIGVFLVGSFLCGLAGEFGTLPLLGDGMNQLIIFRGLQGIGSAGFFAMAFIIISDLFPPSERGRYQGFVGATFGLASVLGPIAGGLLTDHGGGIIPGISGWRWVFYVNIPFAFIALWFIIRRMPPLRPVDSKHRLSYLSAFLLLVGTVPLILALSLDKTDYPWGGFVTISLFAASIVGFGLFVWHSFKDENPVIDLALFKNKIFTVSVLAIFAYGIVFLSTVIFLPLFMVNVVGVSATSSGVTIIPLSLGLVFGNVVAGQLVSKFGKYRPFLIIGGVILIVGVYLLSTMSVHTTFLQATLFMLVCGIGIGPQMPLFPLAIQNSVQRRQIGQATSASQFFRQIGSTVGVAIMGTVLATTLATSFAASMPSSVRSAFSGAGTQKMQQSFMSGDGGNPTQQIQIAFAEQYTLIDRYFKAGDKQALAALEGNPYLPAEYKQQLKAGTPMEAVQKQFDAQYQAIAAAAHSGNVAGLKEVLASSKLPEQAQGALVGIVARGGGQALDGFLAQLKSQFDQQAKTVGEAATTSALAQIKTQLDMQATQVSAQVSNGIKSSFADAITKIYFYLIFISIVGLIISAFVPQIPLRKTLEHASESPAPAVE